VASACSAPEAVRAAGVQRPAAIIVDMTARGMKGEETVEALRRAEGTRDIPVVILGALSTEGTGLDIAQIAGWITRPVGPEAAAGGVRDHYGVLVVEDDEGIASVLREMLARRGITSIHARSGADAVRLATEVAFDLLILDLGLPDADGFAVVQWLQRDHLLSKAPVLVYTARDLDEADRDRLRLGPTEFLTKSRDALEEVEERALAMLGNLIPRGSASAETNPDRG